MVDCWVLALPGATSYRKVTVLREFGHRLQGLVRPTDGVARLGCDEFVVVRQAYEALHPPKQMRARSARWAQFPLRGQRKASAGVAFGTPGDDFQTILQRADAALYEAKVSRSR